MQRLNLAAHGVAITVTPPSGAPVATTGIWHAELVDAQPYGSDLRRKDPRRVMEIPLNGTLTTVPRGSVIVAADKDGAAARHWRVDALERNDDPLRTYVIVVPAV